MSYYHLLTEKVQKHMYNILHNMSMWQCLIGNWMGWQLSTTNEALTHIHIHAVQNVVHVLFLDLLFVNHKQVRSMYAYTILSARVRHASGMDTTRQDMCWAHLITCLFFLVLWFKSKTLRTCQGQVGTRTAYAVKTKF